MRINIHITKVSLIGEREMDERPSSGRIKPRDIEKMGGSGRLGGSGRINPLYVDQVNDETITTQKKEDYTIETAHVVDRDSWLKVGLLMAAGYNSAYIFSYTSVIMVPLGWTWGIINLVFYALLSFFSNWVIAQYQIMDGQRFIRYRDIMGYVYGKKLYYLTLILQLGNLSISNMGFILLAGSALKAINADFSDSPQRLQVYLVVAGVLSWMFSTFVPNLSAMRYWVGISALMTSIYVVVALVFIVKDGKNQEERNYDIPGNSTIDKVFKAFGAMASIVATNNSGLIPEIQSTLKKPAVKNMRLVLCVQYTMGLFVYYGFTILGYWAYGSAVSGYLPSSLSGPKWPRVLINSLAFLQTIPSQHTFLQPVHEALDTKFLYLDESMSSPRNIARRTVLRGLLLGFNTLIACAFPFIGYFLNFAGALTLSPLTFLFPSMLFLMVERRSAGIASKVHWAVLLFTFPFTVFATIAAVRLIVQSTNTYHLFANP